MGGKVSFTFDDGYCSAYDVVYPIFKGLGIKASLGIIGDLNRDRLSADKLHELENEGWEIICHSLTHMKLTDEVSYEDAYREIADGKENLKREGFNVNIFLSPCSACAERWQKLLRENYNGAFTVYTNSQTEPIEKMVMRSPILCYEMNRCSLCSKTLDELKAYIDYVAENDCYLAFYEHDIGVNNNISAENLEALARYIISKNVEVVTPSEALGKEKCLTHRIRRGYDGAKCFVHARMTPESDGSMLATMQYLDVTGNDLFQPVCFARSSNGGMTFSEPFSPENFKGAVREGDLLYCGCDFTPHFHAKTGKTLITGHTAAYKEGYNVPVKGKRHIAYITADSKSGSISDMKFVKTDETDSFSQAGSGCSQVVILENGDILMPVAHRDAKNGDRSVTSVVRCSFDGETLSITEKGNTLENADEPRGYGEGSLAELDGEFFLTLRADNNGYVARSKDGLHFSKPILWRTDDGAVLENYNTQQHWFKLNGELWLVYTRKCGTNDHVFRHRAPLFAAPVDTETLRLLKSREITVVPERGARLGNFAAGNMNDGRAFVMAAEWMQPIGCERYGSDNSIFVTFIR